MSISYINLPKKGEEELNLFLRCYAEIEKEKAMKKEEVKALRLLKMTVRRKQNGDPYRRPDLAFPKVPVSVDDRCLMQVCVESRKEISIKLFSKGDESSFRCLSIFSESGLKLEDILAEAEKKAKEKEEEIAGLETISINFLIRYARLLGDVRAMLESVSSDARRILSDVG